MRYCEFCSLPLVVFNITIEKNGTKIYYHNHCGKEIKRDTGTVLETQKPCPDCQENCEYLEYENGVYTFECAKCKCCGFGGLGGSGSGGVGRKYNYSK